MNILVLEPYYGGSHKTFIQGLQDHLEYSFTLLTLPARKWKWRMRLAAPYFAEKIIELANETRFDAILCSTFVDVATLRSILTEPLNRLPIYTYFHENQFVYPVQKEDERDFHFGLTNLTTALASDRIAFNTAYNLETFLAGVEEILKICPDMKLEGITDTIEKKSSILHPGIDFSLMDAAFSNRHRDKNITTILWNHRWEHDKNPDCFFNTLFNLDKQGIDFRLILLGQSFRREPSIFSEAHEKLKHKIIHSGFVESRDEYARLLTMGDLVISTAGHEFYGISIIEAVRAGCYPLLPNRLSYPELFPAEYLYEDGELFDRLKSILNKKNWLDKALVKSLTKRFSWDVLKKDYSEWFEGLWNSLS